MTLRIITAMVLVVGAFVAPWWSVAAATVFCIVAYRRFVEALAPALIIDVLYGSVGAAGVPGLMTVAAAVLVMLSVAADGYLRGYDRL